MENKTIRKIAFGLLLSGIAIFFFEADSYADLFIWAAIGLFISSLVWDDIENLLPEKFLRKG